jgi:hypothetical protein
MVVAFETWRCLPLTTGGAHLLPMLVFAIGMKHAKLRTFSDARERSLGTLYVVREANATALPLVGAVAERRCTLVPAVELPISAAQDTYALTLLRSRHPAAQAAFHKLAVLDRVPKHVGSIVLIDADTHCVGDCTRKMHQQLMAMSHTGQFVGIGLSGERVLENRKWRRCPFRYVSTRRQSVLRPELQLCRRGDRESFNTGELQRVQWRARVTA